ncbi:MAG: DUF4190 domain-containing protein [Micromonosporaceae bacterium]
MGEAEQDQPSDWLPPRPPEPPTLNRLAVASLVLSVFGGVPGIVCGIIALRQIRRTGQRGWALAVSGIGASAVVLLLVLGIAAWPRIAGVEQVDPRYVSSGDCLNRVSDPGADRVPRVSCRRPHDAEVFATFDYQPQIASLDRYSRTACAHRLDGYAPGASGDPSIAMRIWLLDFSQPYGRGHRIVCLLVSADGTRRTGSAFRPVHGPG